MNAYDKIYLEDAMSNLAVMLDYGKVGSVFRLARALSCSVEDLF